MSFLLHLLLAAHAQAVPNGTIADGGSWTSSGINGGYAGLVTQGTQFSSVETTTGIVFPSSPYARNVRSSGPAPTNSVGILTSETFVLTQPTVQWQQISERTGVNIVFRLLDAGSSELSSASVTPSDGAWATQSFNASAWCGRTVRVEFRQNTLNAGSGWFTLIDNVALTGAVCSGYSDPDDDGTCPNGRDNNNDGDCADSGEQTGPTDCAENDASRGGLQSEVTGNDIDENCDGAVVCWRDDDRDGYGNGTLSSGDGDCADPGEARQAGDCDDARSVVRPGGTEVCAAGDEDCDGVQGDADASVSDRSSWYTDGDGDGRGAGAATLACVAPANTSSAGDDCDDGDALRSPLWAEACDPFNRDEDCDGLADDADSAAIGREAVWWDGDGDGWGDPALGASVCDPLPAQVGRAGDCDDLDLAVSPDAAELCAPGDEDCDGLQADGDPSVSDPLAWYVDGDGDGRGAGVVLWACEAPPGAVPSADDCDDGDALRSPLWDEVCDAADRDEDCDGLADDADSAAIGRQSVWWDGDGDGWGDPALVASVCDPLPAQVGRAGDCDDLDLAVSPDAAELCAPGDEDCDGLQADGDPSVSDPLAWYVDGDGDGRGAGDVLWACEAEPGTVAWWDDCDDADALRSPLWDEVCDAADRDEDCDGLADDADSAALGRVTVWWDGDGDGYGEPGTELQVCDLLPGQVEQAGDCDDGAVGVSPGLPESCAPGDEDCDGLADDADPDRTGATTWYSDSDGDGFGEAASRVSACVAPPGAVATPGDCDDGAATVSPGLAERCDEGRVDEDCDGLVDDDDPSAGGQVTLYVDGDGDGWGDAEVVACHPAPGRVAAGGDCDDAAPSVHPTAPELCAAPDSDCDGLDGPEDDDVTDDFAVWRDEDGDGYGTGRVAWSCEVAPGWSTVGGDCDDTEPGWSPAAPELCRPGDEDCDGREGDADAAVDPSDWYLDADGDGFGAGSAVAACVAPADHVATSGDCDAARADVSPAGSEVCAPGDEDCDGLEGEADPSLSDASPRWSDADGDGWGDTPLSPGCSLPAGAAGQPGDCDDGAGEVNPGAADLPDDLDQDCDGLLTCFVDEDGDAFGGEAMVEVADCALPGTSADGGDCDDADPEVWPGAVEPPGTDADCDGVVWCLLDADGDGWGNAGGVRVVATAEGCGGPGEALEGGDCGDDDAEIYPGAEEIAGNDIDEDCSGEFACYPDADDDGWGDNRPIPSADAACDAPGEADDAQDCDDGDPSAFPGGVDLPGDNVDQDCDGVYVCALDADGDGFGSLTTTGLSASPTCDEPGVALQLNDCDDGDALVNPTGADLPNDGVDQDCDGLWTCSADRDQDGYGSRVETVEVPSAACDGAAADTTDCNDMNDAIHPGAVDAPGDAIDADCDGVDPELEPEDSDVPVDSDVETDVPEPVDTGSRPTPPLDKDPGTYAGGCACDSGGGGWAWTLALLALVRRRR